METTFNHIRMVNLNESNWMIWKSKMEDLLYCKDLFAPVERDSAKPKTTSEDDWKKLNQKAVGYIRQWLDDSVFHHVSTETSEHSLWKKLKDLYERNSVGNKAFLIWRLEYKENGLIAEHLNKVQSIINQLSSMKMTLDDKLQALLLLNSLPDS